MATATTPEAVEATVRDAIASFGPEPADVVREATFEQLDVDSLDLAELSQIVKDTYDVELTQADVKEIETVGQAIDTILARL